MLYKDPFGKEHRYGPPAGWVQPERESLGPDDWDALVERGLEFAPYDGPAVLMTTFGNCLSPLLEGGQHYLRVRPMAPDETLVDGGLYVLEPEDQEEIRRICSERLGVVKTGVVSITKFLRFVGFEWWCVNREGIDHLGMGTVTHQVVGVILMSAVAGLSAGCTPVDDMHARQSLCNNPFDSESQACGQIGLNAATTTIINNTNSGGTGITGFTGLASLGFVVNPSGPAFNCTVIVTATISARQTVGTLGQMKLLVRFADDSVTFVSASQEVPIGSSTYQGLTLQWEFAHSAANAGLGQAGIYVDNTGPSTNSMDWNQATIQVEAIIR